MNCSQHSVGSFLSALLSGLLYVLGANTPELVQLKQECSSTRYRRLSCRRYRGTRDLLKCFVGTCGEPHRALPLLLKQHTSHCLRCRSPPFPSAYDAAQSVYAGPGAGRYPTANSVVNDIVRLARLGPKGVPNPFPLDQHWELASDFEACFYVRVTAVEGHGVLASIAAGADKAGVPVSSVMRGPPGGVDGSGEHAEPTAELGVRTEKCKRSQALAFVKGLKSESWSRGEPVLMSIL